MRSLVTGREDYIGRGCQHRACCFGGGVTDPPCSTTWNTMMSQYNGTISTEASSSRIYIECFHTQITSKCPILYKHRMNHSGEFKAISSVYRKTREFKTDVCVLQSLLSGRVDHSPQSSGHFTTGQSYRKHIKFLSFLPQLKVEMGFGSSCI